MSANARPVFIVNAFERDLAARLDALRRQGLHRELRRVESAPGPRLETGGRTLLNFSSNDYLGLANHPALKSAAVEAIGRYGAGSGSARLICGSLAPHHELEEAIAEFKGTAAALTFSSGYATAVGTIGALLGKDDVIILDKLVHACIVDAARLCGAKLRVFAHNDLDDLEAKLKWAAGAKPLTARVLIVTESVFSMDGDHAPLRALVALKERYGAWLMVDEAHATGLYGAHGRGLAEAAGVADRVEIQMGTLGKALGAAGGYIAGSRLLVDLLVNRARTFIFSTAPVPAQSAAALAAVRLVQADEGERLRRQLWQRVGECRAAIAPAIGAPASGPARTDNPIPLRNGPEAGVPSTSEYASAILPLLVGDEARAVELSASLRERGVFIPAIRFPTVARGSARLRLTITAAHTSADIATLAGVWKSIALRLPADSATTADEDCPPLPSVAVSESAG